MLEILKWAFIIALGLLLYEVIVPLICIALVLCFAIAVILIGIIFYPIAIFIGIVQRIWRR